LAGFASFAVENDQTIVSGFDSSGKFPRCQSCCYETNGKNGKPAGSSGADGVPDGFPDPADTYKASGDRVNKRFSNSWSIAQQLRESLS